MKTEPNDIVVTQAPAHVREMLKDKAVTIPVATAFPAIEAILLEAQRNVVSTTVDKADLPAAIAAIDHLMKHFRLFRDQGGIEIKRRELQNQR
jgi:hypothetical protein